ncbi:MAG: HEPN domain-containing protein [Bacteroidia bacterium]|nr:HEPN domain-containing protein [Bacteroidia bacterium]
MSEKIDKVKQWVEKADHDLGTAQVTFLYIPKFRDTIAFHCQQAVEKYLKGYLFFLDIPFKRLHSLNYLLSLISQRDEISVDLFDKASELEDFAVEIKYPDTIIELTEEDILQAFTIVKEFRIFVLARMNLTIDYEEIKKE